MAAIYDKALKRKDFSGIIDKDKADEAKEKKKSAEEKAKDKKDKKKNDTADDPQAGANIGKIVNLMSGDANRVSEIYPDFCLHTLIIFIPDFHDSIRVLFHLWRYVNFRCIIKDVPNNMIAPLEIVIACAFLYQLVSINISECSVPNCFLDFLDGLHSLDFWC